MEVSDWWMSVVTAQQAMHVELAFLVLQHDLLIVFFHQFPLPNSYSITSKRNTPSTVLVALVLWERNADWWWHVYLSLEWQSSRTEQKQCWHPLLLLQCMYLTAQVQSTVFPYWEIHTTSVKTLHINVDFCTTSVVTTFSHYVVLLVTVLTVLTFSITCIGINVFDLVPCVEINEITATFHTYPALFSNAWKWRVIKLMALTPEGDFHR